MGFKETGEVKRHAGERIVANAVLMQKPIERADAM
jgi:hypothetical protein